VYPQVGRVRLQQLSRVVRRWAQQHG
jgi:hypothetical protein